jgi:PAS domain S-box-containing protein
MEASVPSNEAARLEALHGYGILDTPPESDFDSLTRLASHICGTPMALLTLVDGERQWFKSQVGIDVGETPREVSFCTHAIEQPGLFVVSDTKEDPRFADNPLVLSFPHIRFYAGAPLVTPDGHALGTLCVVDRVPRRLTEEQMEALHTLAAQAMGQLELRRQLRLLQEAVALQERAEAERAAQEARTARQNAALVELAKLDKSDVDAEIRAATRVASLTLGVERAGVWLSPPGDQSEMTCAALYRAATDDHESGAKLRAKEFPAYFAALRECRALAVGDALTDPRTRDFADGYLRPNGIGAMLDVPVWRDGVVAGVLCCEHVGGVRAWTPDEEDFAANVSDLVTLALEAADRRRAEEAARHAQGRGAAVVRAALDCVVVMDGDGRVLDFNPAAERTFGYSAEEAVGKPLADLIIPERYRGAHHLGLERHLKGGAARILGERVETYALRADGTEFPVELTITRVPLDGPPVFTGHLRDITERVESASALERSLSLLRATLESAADGLLVIDRHARVVTANGKFAAMWDLEPASLAPGSPPPLDHVAARVEDPESFRDYVLRMRASPDGESDDEFRLLDGRIVELYSQPQRLGAESVGRVWSFRDVTERRHAEDEARRTAERMRAVASAAAAVVGAETPSELRTMLEEACRSVLSFDAFFIFAYNPREHAFHGFGGNDAGVFSPPDVTPAAGTPAERVVRERRSLLTLSPDDPAAAGARATGTGRRSASVVRTPILVGGEVRGIISVQSYTAERYTAADVEVVEALASLAATALENLRLTAERRQAEAALRRSETRFRALFEQFPFSIQIFSPQGETLQVNHAWERLFLSTPGERRRFNPMTDPQLAEIHPLIRRGFAGEGVELPAVLFDPARVGGGPGRAERPGTDGGARWLQASICPVKDEEGETTEVILVHQDVTDERRAVEELRESEERARTIIETAADAIVTLDEESTILSANPATERTFGYTAEELVGQKIYRLIPERLREGHTQGLARHVATGKRRIPWTSTEIVALRKDGTEIPAEISIGSYQSNGKRIFAGFLRDITERKAAETALREARDELERRVEERTAELAEANMALEEEVAERARAEEEVVQKSAELQAVFHALPDLYFRMEPDGTILDFQAGHDMGLYATPDAFLGRRVQEVLPPHVGERIDGAIRRVAEDGKLTTVEYALEVDDTVQEYEARLLPLDSSGQVVSIVRDITERKGWERELRRREERFRALIENGSDLIAIIGADGITQYLSPSADRLLGWKIEERVGHSTIETIHPEDWPEVARLRDFAVHNPGATIQVEFRYRHGDGSWRVFEAAARTLRPDSAAEGLVVNARDVTERKRAEEALRRSEEHFRAVIENASDLVTILEPDGVMRYQSPAVQRLFGYEPAELEGRSAFELIHPDDTPGVVESLTHVATNPGETRAVAFRWRHKDGSWRYVESVGTTLSRTAPEEGVIVNSRDVTERKIAEEALEQARAEAERAREAAEAANQAKSEFLSRMSHELRTPMNSILGFAQLLDRRSPTPEQKKGVDQILRAGRHLLNLINEVLDIARIESDRQTLSLEAVRLDTALSEAVNLIRPLAAQNSCMVSDPQPAPGRWVHADRQRLAQVLLNLLSNGVKYNRPGGSVRVTWEEGERCIRIGVHDTGRGIPRERMDELFVPFARLGAEETGVEGTGLGLTLSHRLAEAMGGTLTAESQPGRGSTFWLELPASEDPSSRLPRPEPAPAEPREEAPAGGPPATLLYIEDNLANLTLVESLLSSRPEITLLSAMQGRMGLDLAWEHAPDLILLDLHLPDMPGNEVLRRLRADKRTHATPVVVISADATPGQVERLRAGGAHEYITKPLDLDRFMEAVDRILTARGDVS